ncbi:hypothetical protein NA56DRAFT_661273 [Hyaloscypha hepaticicola]|uniref:Uncharacterized protein n=1 Tax=Hyaloscypha hepaticicola TaxID=2082293 RepID=A0A2J6PX77_9HELO|nr:hypothetical protein NA56DRAFT_661273 [Hyaloscypha hepaticicola]
MSETQSNVPSVSSISNMDEPVSTANEGVPFSNATQETQVEIEDAESQTSSSQGHASETSHRSSAATNMLATTFPFISLTPALSQSELRDTTTFEIPDDIDDDEDALEYPSHLDDLSAETEVELTLLAQGHEPLECAFKMYPRILKYAQAFELNINFREEMNLTQDQSLTQEWLGDNYDFYNSNALRNPFKGYLVHPVEAGLMRAKLASDRETLVQFKNERANILEYLENQYQRISAASTRVIDFVKTEENAQYLSILRARKNLLEEDDLSLDSVGCNIDSELLRQDEEINWSFNEPDFDVPEGNDSYSNLSDESSHGDQENEGSENWEESEGESEGSEAETGEQEDVNEEGERSSQDGSDSEDVSDNDQDLEQLQGMLDTGEGLATTAAPQSFEASKNATAIMALNEVSGEYLSAGAEEGQSTEVITDDA